MKYKIEKKLLSKTIFRLFLMQYLFLFYCKINLSAQFKEFYEPVYFNNASLFNPSKIAPNAGFKPLNFYSYKEEVSENKLNISFFLNRFNQNDFNNLMSNDIFNTNYTIGKNAALGAYIDQYNLGLFKRLSYSLKYGYQIVFNDNIKLAAGFSIGNIHHSISVSNSNNSNTINNLLNDTRVREFNNNSNIFYTDVGINLMIQNLNLQFVKYHADKNLNKDIIQDEPDFFASMDYTIENDLLIHKIAFGLINYFNKNVDKMFVNYTINYNPIALNFTANTLQQYSSNIEITALQNIVLFLGYNFGGYYANPVNNGAGNILAGFQLKLF